MGLSNDEMKFLVDRGVIKRYTGVVIKGLSYNNNDGYAIQDIVVKDGLIKIVVKDDLGLYRGYSSDKIMMIDEMDAHKCYEAYLKESNRGRPKKILA